jgi:hypothetical protein
MKSLNVTKQISNGNADHSPAMTAGLPKRSFKFKLIVFMLCLTSVVVAMDSAIVTATLPAIAVALKRERLGVFLIGMSYILSRTVGVQTF